MSELGLGSTALHEAWTCRRAERRCGVPHGPSVRAPSPRRAVRERQRAEDSATIMRQVADSLEALAASKRADGADADGE